MNCFSWEKRIRRAEQLANEHAASAELLRFYAQVARFQQAVSERLKSSAADASGPSSLEPDYPHLLRLVQRIGPGPLAARASDLEKEGRSLEEVLAIVWNGTDTSGASADLQFFARVLLQPYMENA